MSDTRTVPLLEVGGGGGTLLLSGCVPTAKLQSQTLFFCGGGGGGGGALTAPGFANFKFTAGMQVLYTHWHLINHTLILCTSISMPLRPP